MIQDLVYQDLNQDGKEDLIVTGHWMGVFVYYANEKGFDEALVVSADKKGWFNSLEIADVNNDGLLDIITGNEGMNNKYSASDHKPLGIYLNDFDDSGSYDIVLVKDEEGKTYPVRGKECSSEQVPLLNDKFKSYDAFATSDVFEIYTADALSKAYYAEVNEFRHGIFYQNSTNSFSFSPLPHASQICQSWIGKQRT